MAFVDTVIEQYQDHTQMWRRELAPWLPNEIFDAHVHLGPPEIVGPIATSRKKEALSTFGSLTWEQARDFYPTLYQGKNVVGLIAFGFPLREVNISAANRYLISAASRDNRIHPFLLVDPYDIPGTIRQFHELSDEFGVSIKGFKPYYDLLKIEKPNSGFHCCDLDFTPLSLLEFIDQHGLALMLHTSGNGGGDQHVQKFIQLVATKFPHVRLILAHMSRYTEPNQFERLFYSSLLDHPNIFLEMSSASSPLVYKLTLSRRDLWNRLLFGSDIPFGLITGTEHWSDELGPVFITRDEYTWSDSKLNQRFQSERVKMTYNTYHTIFALRQAMDQMSLPAAEAQSLKEAIFCTNAQRLLSNAGAQCLRS